MGGGKAPKPPDPEKTAAAQTKSNRETAITQAYLNQTNQVNPYGSLTYTQTGTAPDGTPTFTATTALSPEQQKLYEQQTGLSGQYNTIAGDQLDRIQETLSNPFDLNTAANDQYSEIARQRLDPLWDQRWQNEEANLAARGVMPGTEAYDRARNNFEQSRTDAYNQMFLTGRSQAVSEALAQRNQPLSEINALRGGGQAQNPQFTNTPQTGVANTDVAGITNAAYQNQLAAWQANQASNPWGSILSTAGKVGGWIFSDERVKDDYGVMGMTREGLPVHAFRYKGEPVGIMRAGLMAQEVERVKPQAVRRGPGGVMQVNYRRAMGA